MTTEIIKKDELENYITSLFDGNPTGRGVDLARLRHRLKTGTNTKEELQQFMEWRKNVLHKS